MIEVIVFVVLIFFRNRRLFNEDKIKDKLFYILNLIFTFPFFFYYFTQFRIESSTLKAGLDEMISRYELTGLSNTTLYIVNILYFIACVWFSALLIGIGQLKEKSRKFLLKSIFPLWIVLSGHAYIYALNDPEYRKDISIVASFFVVAIPLVIQYLFYNLKRVRRMFLVASTNNNEVMNNDQELID